MDKNSSEASAQRMEMLIPVPATLTRKPGESVPLKAVKGCPGDCKKGCNVKCGRRLNVPPGDSSLSCSSRE
jgi:hypothetical protein